MSSQPGIRQAEFFLINFNFREHNGAFCKNIFYIEVSYKSIFLIFNG